MTEGESMTLLQRRKAQNAAMLSQLFSTMIVMAVSGQYMILYANDVLGLSPQKIALLLSLAPFISILRLPAMPVVQKVGLVATMQYSRIGQAIVIALLIAIPAAVLNLPLLSLLVVVFIFFREIGLATVWQTLMRNITTTEDRGHFFARMRTSFSLINLTLSALVALFIGSRLEEFQYKAILALAIFGSINSLLWARAIPEPPPAQNNPRTSARKALKSMGGLLRSSPLFRIPLLVTLVISMGQLPIGLVYFREGLNVPANLLGIQIFCATLGQVISLMFWGKASDTLGFRPLIAGLLWLASGISLLLWATPVFPESELSLSEIFNQYPLGVTVLLIFGFGNGILNAGLGIATTSVMHYHVDTRNSLVAINVFTLLQMGFQAVLMLMLGVVIEHFVIPSNLETDPLTLFHFDLFKLYRCGLVPLLMLLIIPFVLRLPNLKPWFSVTDFFSVFRYNPVRSLMGNRHVYDEDESQRIDLARSLYESPSPLNLQILNDLLKDPSYEVKAEAIRSLARSRASFAGKILLDILRNPERRGLWDLAAWGLGELRYTEAVPDLIDCLKPEYPGRIRSSAARALGKIGDPRAVQPILRAMSEEDKQFHVIASYAWALLFLEAEERADVAFECILRLRDREERYELLSILSRWLNISDKWLLISDAETGAADSLESYLTGFSQKWIQSRSEIINAFQQRDFREINRLLRREVESQTQPADPILLSLLNVLENKAADWSPLSVLACAWLLFGNRP